MEENQENITGTKKREPGKFIRMIGRGETLVTLIRCDKYFPHILYGFFLIFMVIVLNLMIEKTLVEMEANRQKINDLKISLTYMNTELIGIEKLSSVQQLLESTGSDLTIPDDPAIIIK